MKRSLLLAVTVLAIAVLANGTIAYFTSRDSAENVYEVGAVRISLDEPSWDPDDEHVISPGVAYAKDPQVRNIGTVDAYTRIHLTISDYAAIMERAPSGFDLLGMLDIGGKWTALGTPEVVGDELRCSYGYTEILEKGKTSEPLFTEVSFPAFIDGSVINAMDGKFDVTVKADAIQSYGFTDYNDAFAVIDAALGGV